MLRTVMNHFYFFKKNGIANIGKRKRDDRPFVIVQICRPTVYEPFGGNSDIVRWIQLTNIHRIDSSDCNISM